MYHYGIEKSTAHYWVHVCPLDAGLFVYPRNEMVKILSRYKDTKGDTYIGKLVDIRKHIKTNGGFITFIEMTYPLFKEYNWSDKDLTVLGCYGEEVFKRACDQGVFRLPCYATLYNQIEDQYKGRDFLVKPLIEKTFVEVKVDRPGGIWGSGNLFVQTHEKRA
jgi:hypothetical protein